MQTDNHVIPFEYRRQLYFVRPLLCVEEALDASDFLHEGWVSLCDVVGGRGDIAWDDFFKKVLRIVSMPVRDGIVFVMMSKSRKPLGFMLIHNDSESETKRTCIIYAGYSNGKDAQGSLAGTAFAEQWARSMKFVELHAQSRRINGSALRFFRKKLGFSPVSIVLSKTL